MGKRPLCNNLWLIIDSLVLFSFFRLSEFVTQKMAYCYEYVRRLCKIGFLVAIIIYPSVSDPKPHARRCSPGLTTTGCKYSQNFDNFSLLSCYIFRHGSKRWYTYRIWWSIRYFMCFIWWLRGKAWSKCKCTHHIWAEQWYTSTWDDWNCEYLDSKTAYWEATQVCQHVHMWHRCESCVFEQCLRWK